MLSAALAQCGLPPRAEMCAPVNFRPSSRREATDPSSREAIRSRSLKVALGRKLVGMEELIYTRRNPAPFVRTRPTKITVPERVGPHVKLLFTEMRRQNITYDEVEIGSGVRRAALKAWRHKNRPNLDSIEAALGFMGWDFVAVPRAKVLPAEVVEELRNAAARLDTSLPATVQALVEMVTGIHARFGERPSAAYPAKASDAREAPQAPEKRPRGRPRRSAAHDKVLA